MEEREPILLQPNENEKKYIHMIEDLYFGALDRRDTIDGTVNIYKHRDIKNIKFCEPTIPGDGLCLFHSMAKAMKLTGPNEKSDDSYKQKLEFFFQQKLQEIYDKNYNMRSQLDKYMNQIINYEAENQNRYPNPDNINLNDVLHWQFEKKIYGDSSLLPMFLYILNENNKGYDKDIIVFDIKTLAYEDFPFVQFQTFFTRFRTENQEIQKEKDKFILLTLRSQHYSLVTFDNPENALFSYKDIEELHKSYSQKYPTSNI